MVSEKNGRRAPIWLLVLGLATTCCRCGTAGVSPVDEALEGPASSASSLGAPAGGDSSGGSPGLRIWPDDPGPVDVTLMVNTEREVHAISPYIYGINFDMQSETQRWGIIRFGGNRLTAYNWETNASNAGSDWHYQNDGDTAEDDRPAVPYLATMDGAARIGVPAIITVSNSDYVSGDKNGGGDVRQSGPDYLKTRFKRNYPKKPGPFASPPDSHDDAVYQDELVAYLRAQRPNTKLLLSMDNEPDLWTHTHEEVFTKPLTYADLWRRNHTFAKGVKDVCPDCEVLGFVSYGYLGFISLQNAPDNGGRNFIEWYLDQAKAAEAADGKRVIDYLDVHWYPEVQSADGERITTEGTSPALIVAREQAPRSLWDKSFDEKSWIRDMAGAPLDLIHWLKAKIKGHYPGTKLAFTEWNYGGGKHISGAIAVVDVLGVFGKYGVDLATYWALNGEEPFAFAGFRAFRNFDSAGGAFGDRSVGATTSNVEAVTVYASIDSKNPRRMVIVAINKSDSPKKTGIKVAAAAQYRTAEVFRLTGAEPNLLRSDSVTAVGNNAFAVSLPAQSVSVFVPQP